MAAAASGPGLCFTQASQKFKDNEITQDEYHHNILAHCTGYLHDEDDDGHPSMSYAVSSLPSDDPFAYAVQCFMKKKDFIKDITPLEDAFKALDKRDMHAIQEAAAKLPQGSANKFFHEILALRALQLRKAEVLKYCLDFGGFPYAVYFEDEANRVKEVDDPETFKVLEESHFRNIYPREKAEEGTGNVDDEDIDDSNLTLDEKEKRERDRIAADFDEGGEYPVDW